MRRNESTSQSQFFELMLPNRSTFSFRAETRDKCFPISKRNFSELWSLFCHVAQVYTIHRVWTFGKRHHRRHPYPNHGVRKKTICALWTTYSPIPRARLTENVSQFFLRSGAYPNTWSLCIYSTTLWEKRKKRGNVSSGRSVIIFHSYLRTLRCIIKLLNGDVDEGVGLLR